MTERDRLTRRRLVVWAWVLLNVGPFIYTATTREFWETIAPLATLLILALLAGVVFQRLWAWILAVAVEIAVLLSWSFSPGPWYWIVLNVVSLALLMSPQMREHIRSRQLRANS